MKDFNVKSSLHVSSFQFFEEGFIATFERRHVQSLLVLEHQIYSFSFISFIFILFFIVFTENIKTKKETIVYLVITWRVDFIDENPFLSCELLLWVPYFMWRYLSMLLSLYEAKTFFFISGNFILFFKGKKNLILWFRTNPNYVQNVFSCIYICGSLRGLWSFMDNFCHEKVKWCNKKGILFICASNIFIWVFNKFNSMLSFMI